MFVYLCLKEVLRSKESISFINLFDFRHLFYLNETTLASSLVPDVVREPDALLDFGVDRLLPLDAAATVKLRHLSKSPCEYFPFGPLLVGPSPVTASD